MTRNRTLIDTDQGAETDVERVALALISGNYCSVFACLDLCFFGRQDKVAGCSFVTERAGDAHPPTVRPAKALHFAIYE
jgi:hypothetical protein